MRVSNVTPGLLTSLALALAMFPAGASAATPFAPPTTPAASCEAAGAQAERDWNLPTGLLAAIGRMESGRFDPQGGRVVAWPWTINAEGQGVTFANRQDAVAEVAALQMRGVQSIDVGCFQINLMYHPDAFASLDAAFDIRANADYAARFLSDLHARSGSWETAVAWYHSATPGLGEPYRDRVLADWAGNGIRVGLAARLPEALGRADPYVLHIAAPIAAPISAYVTDTSRGNGDLTNGIRVWMPGQMEPAARPGSVAISRIAASPTAAAWPDAPARRGLPRIVTPD